MNISDGKQQPLLRKLDKAMRLAMPVVSISEGPVLPRPWDS